MEEIRVYRVGTDMLAEAHIKQPVADVSDEDFVTLAEDFGNVWTLNGFLSTLPTVVSEKNPEYRIYKVKGYELERIS